MMDNPQRSYL